jgi:hypothetical protein
VKETSYGLVNVEVEKHIWLVDFIVDLLKTNKTLNALIITPAPTETVPQFTDDLFNKFKEFEPFKVHCINGSNINNIELSNNNIFVASKQLLQKYIKTPDSDTSITTIKNLDLIIFDENHFGGTTDLSKSILQTYASKNTTKIYLTATYNKPLKEWGIPQECQMYWDIEDEQICKSILVDKTENIKRLEDKHGKDIVNSTVKYFEELGITDMFSQYNNMPDLILLTRMFDSERYNNIKNKIMDSKYGFSFETLFSLNDKKTQFQFYDEVKVILRYISGSNKEEDFKNGDESIFGRIKYTCSKYNSRPPFTQLWFLPSNNINEISLCLEELMKQDPILNKYDVICINRKNKDLSKTVQDDILKQEKITKDNKKRGLIILAGNMLSLGITLNNCDVVNLMNDSISSDKVFQQMYRCMTEGEGKKIGIVVDLNTSRVINNFINYTIHKNNKSFEDKLTYLVRNHLINIDVDMMEHKNLNSDAIIKKILDMWKSDPINTFKLLLNKIDNDYIEFDSTTQKQINHLFKSKATDKNVLTVTIKDDEDEEQKLPKGKEKIKNDTDEKEYKVDEDEDEEEDEITVNFTKDVLPYIIPLTCLLTIKETHKDFINMLTIIQKNKELLEIFDDMCSIWWKTSGLISTIKKIVEKHFDKISSIYSVSVQFKLSLKSLLDRPKELLELINDCLKPKVVEKKTYGEVYTPIKLVDEMLDKLPQSVWKNKNLKWLDNSCGMGNFQIAVYMRLMETLKDIIEDEKERKRHILENMLFMCDLNKKNVFICKQIFDINNEYKLNLCNNDSLTLNYKEEFGIDSFDLIIGNPPYQVHGAGGDNKLYLSFTQKSLELLKEGGHLLYITPTNVKEYLTVKDKNRSYINKFYNIKYLSMNTTSHYFPGIGSHFCVFLMQKTIVKECIVDVEFKRNKVEKSKVTLKEGSTIPVCMSQIDFNILNKTTNILEPGKYKTFNIEKASYLEKGKKTLQRIRKEHITKGKVSQIETKDFQYKIIDKISTKNPFPGVYYYNNKPMINYGKSKTIMCSGGYLMPEFDEDGDYNLSDNMLYILTTEAEYECLKRIINSTFFEYLLKVVSGDGLHGRFEIIQSLKEVNLEDIETDEDVYKAYNLTQEEINFINNTMNKTVKPKKVNIVFIEE